MAECVLSGAKVWIPRKHQPKHTAVPPWVRETAAEIKAVLLILTARIIVCTYALMQCW